MDSSSTPTLTIDNGLSRSSSSNCVDAEYGESLNSLIDKEDTDTTSRKQCSMSCTDNKDVKKKICFNPIGQTVWGVILIVTSISGFIIPPLDVLLWERMNMRPGFPPFDWWADPPDEVRMRAHIFNVTNHERFLQGLDSKINVEEVGPLVYLEKLKHYNITFNDNGTMTYTAKRYLIYLPEENTIDFNSTVIVPNLALLGMLSYLHDANYFTRTAVKILASSHDSQFFVKRTIHEYLWDFREPILETTKNLAPGMVPDTNMGVLNQIYADFTDDYTVKIGPRWSHRDFFQIERVRGEDYITGYDPDKCPDRLTGATEGVMYHQHLRKDDVLLCLRKTACRLMPLYYEKEDVLHGVQVYRFVLPETVFDRRKNGTDCYASEGEPLPDGLSDTSKCFFNLPMVASFPHFYTGAPAADKYVTGLKPDPEKHNSFVYVEPTTGIPYKAVARLQCNIWINDLTSFYSEEFNKFSNLVLPLGWIEYNQEGLPTHVRVMVYFMTVILPPLSTAIFIVTLLSGTYLIMKQIISIKIIKASLLQIKKQKVDNLAQNKLFSYEKEEFLKKSDS